MAVPRPAAVGFHDGELAVQQRAGVASQAARLNAMVARGELRSGMAAFVSDATFAAVTGRDHAGRLWTSPLAGPPGYLRAATPTTLRMETSADRADPLHGLPAGQSVGVVVIDFLTRRRLRINGHLTRSDDDGLTVDVDQVYGNCPRYIQQRVPHLHMSGDEGDPDAMSRDNVLQPADVRLVQSADTFFLGTTHPDAGNDTSHRGGPAGFVSAATDHLSWPDYPGNNVFNSLGNLAVDATASLLFIDFATGATLALSGTATVRWKRLSADDGQTDRRVHFTPRQVVTTGGLRRAEVTKCPSCTAQH